MYSQILTPPTRMMCTRAEPDVDLHFNDDLFDYVCPECEPVLMDNIDLLKKYHIKDQEGI